MEIVSEHTRQLVPILMMALALSVDALSLGVGIGMRGVRLLEVLKISVLIGLFHGILPLLGLFTGQFAGELLGDIAVYAGGGLLILLGAHMIYSSFQNDDTVTFHHRTPLGLVLVALTVSIDSFSVGISLGLFALDLWLTVCIFGLMGLGMSVIGLLLGKRVSFFLGEYGEALGGVILLAFGVKFFL